MTAHSYPAVLVLDHRAVHGWRFAVANIQVAEDISRIIPGEIRTSESPGWVADFFPGFPMLDIVIPDPSSKPFGIYYKQYGVSGLIHHCDGEWTLTGSEEGTPCGCPADSIARMKRAEKGVGPRPYVWIDFRLAGSVDIGIMRFDIEVGRRSTGLYESLLKIDGEFRCRLAVINENLEVGGTAAYFRRVVIPAA